MSHTDAIKKNYDVLQRCTTINLYVIDFLRAKDVLDDAQESDLKAERSHLRQRILLFQWLKEISSDRYESFLKVMKDAEQEHVANLLIGKTEGDHLPLSDARYGRLMRIRYKMAEVTRIDSEVIAELRSLKAISMTDAEEIREETVDYAKVSKLISAIMRRSNYSFNSFQEVLRKTLQTAAAEYLEEGEMSAVHLNSNRPDLDGPLSLAFNDVVTNKKSDDAEINDSLARLNGFGLNPVNAKPGHSIVIFIYCKTVDSASKFTQLFNSGRLQCILEEILNRLLLTIEPHNTETLNSNINLEDEEVITLEEFTGIEGWMVESLHRSKLLGKGYSNVAMTQTEHLDTPLKSEEILIAPESEFKFPDSYEECFYLKEKLEREAKKKQSLIKQLEEHQRQIESQQQRLTETNLDEYDIDSSTYVDIRRLSPDVQGVSKYKPDPALVLALGTKFAEDGIKKITGLTILGKELFVVSQSFSEVQVYNSMKLSFSRQWNVKELIHPFDIGSCNRSKCLYILDFKGLQKPTEILKVHPNGKLTKRWSTGNDVGWTLSVTDESTVILIVNDKSKLNEYSPDGQLIREINLSSQANIRYPCHAIKLTNGHFVVSHGFGCFDLHKVSIVDTNGKLQKSFGGILGSTIGKMNRPIYLTVDRNGSVMVADQCNGRILLLDSDLNFKKEFVLEDKQGLQNPVRIVLDEPNGRLFVADNDWNMGGIFIFQVK